MGRSSRGSVVGRLARSSLLALVGVIAVALAAATLTSVVSPTGGAIGVNGTGSGGFLSPPSPGSPYEVPVAVPPVLFSALAVLLLLAGLWYVLVQRFEALRFAVGIAVAVAAIGLLLVALSQFSGGGASLAGNGSVVGTGGGGGGVSTGETDPTLPSPLLVVLFGIAAVAAVAVLARSSRSSEEHATDEADAEMEQAAAVGRAAGRAADRIEGAAAVDNEVYRAWAEMTALLDAPDPETSTPREFAAAAIDAGLAPDDVHELTDLFETVRYGGVDPDAATEARAVAVLRRIESAYAGDDA